MSPQPGWATEAEVLAYIDLVSMALAEVGVTWVPWPAEAATAPGRWAVRYRPPGPVNAPIVRKALAITRMRQLGPEATMTCWAHRQYTDEPVCTRVRCCDVARDPLTVCDYSFHVE